MLPYLTDKVEIKQMERQKETKGRFPSARIKFLAQQTLTFSLGCNV